MMNLSFSLSNPFSRLYRSKTLYTTMLTEFKCLEIEYSRDNTIIDFWFRWTFRQSHAGLMIGGGLLSFSLYVTLEDIRHWNYDNNCWEKYEDEIENY